LLRWKKGGTRRALTYEQLETCLMLYWRRVHGDSEHRDQKKASEVTFSAVATKTNSKIKCHRCGQRGHIRKECPAGNKEKVKRKGTASKFGRCDKTGHCADNCWFDPDNKHNRPEWLREKLDKESNKELSNVGTDAKFEVICLGCGVQRQELGMQMFPKALRLLNDPNIWIGDTGASVDMTPYAEGLTDTCPRDISVHVGNDEYTAATHCGRLPMTELNYTVRCSLKCT
jgi:hypothetical protein